MIDIRKVAFVGAILGLSVAASAAHAQTTVTDTANGTTTVQATNTQQTNIITTVVGGGTSSVTITLGGTVTSGPGALSTPTGGVTISITLPSGGISALPAAPNGSRSLGGGLSATPNADGTFTVTNSEGTVVGTLNNDGTPVQVNFLNTPDNSQIAMIEQFRFDRANGFKTTQSGASAGGVDGKLAVWINGGYSTFDEDQTAIDADGDTWTLGVGADWQFTERLIAGLSFAGSLSDTTTTFNNGSIDTTGYTIAPYAVAILGPNRNFLLDGSFGFTMNDNDAERSNGAITSSYDSRSTFVSGNVTYIFNRGNFRVQPKVGVLFLWNTTKSYTESAGAVVPETKTRLGRLSAGAKLEYTKNPKFTPFVSLTGEYDWETEDYSEFTGANRPSVEDKGATLGAGFSTQISERLTGDISGTTALGRDGYSAYTLSGTLRFSF